MEASTLPPSDHGQLAPECRKMKGPESPGGSHGALIMGIGAIRIRDGHLDAHEDICDTRRVPKVEPGATFTQASLDAIHE